MEEKGILIVEDDRDDASRILKSLSNAGLHATELIVREDPLEIHASPDNLEKFKQLAQDVDTITVDGLGGKWIDYVKVALQIGKSINLLTSTPGFENQAEVMGAKYINKADIPNLSSKLR